MNSTVDWGRFCGGTLIRMTDVQEDEFAKDFAKDSTAYVGKSASKGKGVGRVARAKRE